MSEKKHDHSCACHEHDHHSCGCHEHEHEHDHHECGCHEHHHEHDHHECGCHEHHHEHDRHDHDCGCSCGCGHDHSHADGGFTVGEGIKYVIGGLLTALGFMSFLPFYIDVFASVAAYLLFGSAVWSGMIKGFRRGRIFTEFTLMCAATLGAFAIGEWADAAAVMILYSLGERISHGAHERSRANIRELMEVAPEYATVIRKGEHIRLSPREVAVGEEILVTAGERIPLDGVIIWGRGSADTSSITGEATPKELFGSITVLSGFLVTEGAVRIITTAEYENSAAAKLEAAVREAGKRKSSCEKKISRFARVFTPAAFILAVVVAALGGAITGNYLEWIKLGLSVLVISCPCSLVLSVPLTYFAGMGSGAKQGIVFKGGEVIDGMARLSAVCFDKTGTLTESKVSFEGTELLSDMDMEAFIDLSYEVLMNSPHVAAVSFCEEMSGRKTERVAENVQIVPGRGIIAYIDGQRAVFGNAAFMRENGADIADSRGTAIFGMLEGKLLGRVDFSSKVKTGAAEAVSELKKSGCRVALLSGDGEGAVGASAEALGIDERFAGLAPHQKSERFENIYNEEKKRHPRGAVAFCGDGLNDSAVVMRADVGIAMGEGGSALTVESADLVIMDGSPEKLLEARRLAKRVSRIANENIAIALGIKALILAIGFVSLSLWGKSIPMELAIVADVGAALATVLNALRS